MVTPGDNTSRYSLDYRALNVEPAVVAHDTVPYGTDVRLVCIPGSKLPGYHHWSLRDKSLGRQLHVIELPEFREDLLFAIWYLLCVRASGE